MTRWVSIAMLVLIAWAPSCERRDSAAPATQPIVTSPAASRPDVPTEAELRAFRDMLAQAERARHEPPETQPGETLLRFRARVLSVGDERHRGREGVVVGIDARWALELHIDTVDQPDEIFRPDRDVLLWIHSPAMLFSGRPKKGVHNFWIVREDSPPNAAPRYKHLRLDDGPLGQPPPQPPGGRPQDG